MTLPKELKPKVKGIYGTFLTIGIGTLIATVFGFISSSIHPLIFPVLGSSLIGITYFVMKQTTYTITEDKIIKHSKVFGETHEEIPINKIQNTTAKSSFIQQKLGNYGSITITTAGGSTSSIRIWAIKDYDKINRLINKLTSEHEDTPTENTQTTLFDEAQKLRKAVEQYEQTQH